jgi:RNA recognition motif-containing protein
MSEKQAKNQAKDQKQRKIFVGGICKDVSEEALNKYFSQFGEVDRTVVNREHYTDKSRGSGFVLFKNSSSVKKVLEQEKHVLNDKPFDCQPCLLREEVKKTKKEQRLKNLESSSTQCSQKSRKAQDNKSVSTKSKKSNRKSQHNNSKRRKKRKNQKRHSYYEPQQ